MTPTQPEAAESTTTAEAQTGTSLFAFVKDDSDKKLLEFKSKSALDEWLEAQNGVEILQVIRGVNKPIRRQTKIFLY